MSVEAHGSFEGIIGPEKRIRAVEQAVKAVARIRLLIQGCEDRIKLEGQESVVDLEMIKYLKREIERFEGELEDVLAFLEEFDPFLFQKLKDNN